MGMRLAVDKQNEYAKELVERLASYIGEELAVAILSADQLTEPGIFAQRDRVKALKEKLAGNKTPAARDLLAVADELVKKSVWIIGGDGWGYDIGFGGLDHVLASDANVNILLLDTEVYSNTGGQMSKATPLGAVAKFAAGGKRIPKKDIAMMAMNYGRAYVAHIAMGGNDGQTMKAFAEAEAHNGPSLVIAYSHCIAHGYDMVHGIEQQKNAVLSGHWPLFRYNPGLAKEGKNPFQLDSRAPSIPLEKYIYNETRYTMLVNSDPEEAKLLLLDAVHHVVAVRDAVAGGNHERRPVVRLCLGKSLHGLSVVTAHRDVGPVSAPVVHRHHGDVFLRDALAASGELRHRAQRRCLRHLSAGVGVNLGIEQQDVDIGVGSQHVIESAESDVIAPAIATDDPDALLDQFVGHGQQVTRCRRLVARQLFFQRLHPIALGEDARLGGLIGAQNRDSQVFRSEEHTSELQSLRHL